MIDPYASVNERIRRERRTRGRRDDEYDAVIRAASQELGAATEAALGLFVDVAERVGLRYLEEAARRGATRRFRWAPDAVRAARYASTRMPAAGGRAVSTSSEYVVRAVLSAVRELRRRLEGGRRYAAGGGGQRPGGARRGERPPPRTAGRARPKPDARRSRRPPSRPDHPEDGRA